MFTVRYSTIAVAVMISLMISDVVVRINSFTGVSNGSTLGALLLNVFAATAMLAFALRRPWRHCLPAPARWAWVALLIWSLITFVRGGFVAEDYWAIKSLVTIHLFMFLTPLAMLIGLDPKLFQRIPRAVLWVLVPVALLLLPVSLSFDTELFARVVMPTYLMLLLLPFIGRRFWLPIVAVACLSVAMDPTYRANLIRIAVACVVVLLYVSRIGLQRRVLGAGLVVLIVSPMIFLILGLTGSFDVFSDGISIGGAASVVEGGQIRESEISADTRTFLYREVLTSMQARGSSFLVGQGDGTGYESQFFESTIIAADGRLGSEVGFLNTLLYSGLIGVGLYGLVIAMSAFYAFYRSRNDLCKMMGLFLLMKWGLFFIEEVPKLDLNYFITWIMIGLCFSRSFRAMDNNQVKIFLARGRSDGQRQRAANDGFGNR